MARSGLPCPPPEDLPNPGIEPWSLALQVDSLPLMLPENQEKLKHIYCTHTHTHTHMHAHTHTHTHTHTITPVVELYLLRQVYVEGVFFLLSAGVRRSLFFNLLEKNIGLYYF